MSPKKSVPPSGNSEDLPEDPHGRRLLAEGDTYYVESLFSPDESLQILRKLDEQIVYLPRMLFQFTIFNRTTCVPRDMAFYGDVYPDGSRPIIRYRSHKDSDYPEVRPWPQELRRLRRILFEVTGQKFNHCVVNQYLDGSDYIGYHFDKTRDYVPDSSIATLSFGGKRTLRLKHTKTGKTENIPLGASSLFVLGWDTNLVWKHSIVKTKASCARRVSLTYRLVKTIKRQDGTLFETDGSDVPI